MMADNASATKVIFVKILQRHSDGKTQGTAVVTGVKTMGFQKKIICLCI